MNKFILGIVYFGLITMAGCVTIYNPATQREEMYFIDDNTEVALGKNIANDILKETKVIDDKKTTLELQELGIKVSQVSDRTYLKYKFYALADKEMNAFALPGGYVFVNSGLISRASKDELAFVVGHEIGHICARHSVKKLQASLGLSLLMSVALNKPDYQVIRRAVNIVYNLVALGYSRQDEFLADSLGVKYAYLAGYDPQGAISMLDKLEKEAKTDNSLIFFSSHPSHKDRIKNIQITIDKLK